MKRAGKAANAKRGRKAPPGPTLDPDETTARFQQQVDRRLQQLRSQVEVNEKFNRGLAQAIGLDLSKFPPELRRELDDHGERTSKAEPPPLPKD
jgi:hypothetical protein